MPAGPRYFLSEDGRRTGPHSLAVLQQKAGLGVLKPTTPIAPETAPDTWSPINTSPALSEELFPARRSFTLRAPPIETPTPALEPPPALSVEEILRINLARQRTAEGELLAPLPPRANRRLRDYLFTVAAAAGVSMIPWLFVPVTAGHILLTAAAAAFVALCAAWIFFVVMDRY